MRTASHRSVARRSPTLGLALLASCVVAARAQQPGDPARPSDPATLASDPAHASPYLPLDHWAYPVLDYWISMGRIDDLSPLVQPYRRLDVARAIEALLGQPLSDVEEKWLFRLEEELEPEIELSGTLLPAGRMALSARVGASYASQTHRDPLRPALDGPFSADRFLERAFLEGRGEIGPLAAGFRVGRDGMFLHDAQFPDGRVVPRKVAPVLDELGVRVEEAYVELQTEHAAVGFGRLYRNWGLPGAFGFARSDYAYTEEELFYRFGFDRLYVTGSLASLRDFAGDTTRYLSMHRLEARPAKSLVLAVTEAAIHGGPSQPLDLALVNPLGIWNIARVDGEPRKNVVGQLDAWWRAGRGVALYGSLLADATGRTESNRFCCQMGGALGFELSALAPGWIVRVQAAAIQSLAYRTPAPWETWAVQGIGLGWDKSDLYLLSVGADWLRPGGLLLRPRLDLQVLGEGDFRAPRPSDEELEAFPDILVGETERTLRAALGGRWRPAGDWGLDVEWDLGVNLIADYGHEPGVDRSAFVGRLAVSFETPPWVVASGN